ncbi:MAG TPA: cell division protein SepF [Propionibacteriaceae bacterium]|nr:cell division protein SepF [Propionibacteriaceae bacterium]
MADLIKRGAAWLGLVADHRYDDHGELIMDELTESVAEDPQLVERTASVTALPSRRPMPEPADLSRIVTVHPKTFNDAKTIGESFRDGFPVIMNLTDMEDFDAKRLVDFAAGLIFGLRGTFEKVTNKVFLLSPSEVTVTAEDRERIAGGFYNQS